MLATNGGHPRITLRTVLAEDEHLARTKLSLLLQKDPAIEVVAECRNAEETRLALRTHKPDLLLLDIQMPGGSGFDVLSDLPLDESPMVIFTTAYDQYAVQAFEAHALDYLLKPYDEERLCASIERAKKEWIKSKQGDLTNHFLGWAKDISRVSRDDRIVIKSRGRVMFLNPEEIDWMEACANYIRLHVGKQSFLLRETVGRMVLKLDPTRFGRIHRSIIVNFSKIREVVPCNSSEYIVTLHNGKELSCSRGHRATIQKLLDKKL
ncbi:MAG: response regulator transcription factor [Acidobacteria bacterium]|nr:response regulator transcription factor [Acidobacteriota bacterium]